MCVRLQQLDALKEDVTNSDFTNPIEEDSALDYCAYDRIYASDDLKIYFSYHRLEGYELPASEDKNLYKAGCYTINVEADGRKFELYTRLPIDTFYKRGNVYFLFSNEANYIFLVNGDVNINIG